MVNRFYAMSRYARLAITLTIAIVLSFLIDRAGWCQFDGRLRGICGVVLVLIAVVIAVWPSFRPRKS